jgi:hypothetical protein
MQQMHHPKPNMPYAYKKYEMVNNFLVAEQAMEIEPTEATPQKRRKTNSLPSQTFVEFVTRDKFSFDTNKPHWGTFFCEEEVSSPSLPTEEIDFSAAIIALFIEPIAPKLKPTEEVDEFEFSDYDYCHLEAEMPPRRNRRYIRKFSIIHPDALYFTHGRRSLKRLQRRERKHLNKMEIGSVTAEMLQSLLDDVKAQLPEFEEHGITDMIDMCINYFSDYLRTTGTKIVCAFLLVPTVMSFVTLVTSMISLFRDKAYVTGGVGVVASAVSLLYNMTFMVGGAEMAIKTLKAYRDDLTSAVEEAMMWFNLDKKAQEMEIKAGRAHVIVKRRSYSPSNIPIQTRMCQQAFDSSLNETEVALAVRCKIMGLITVQHPEELFKKFYHKKSCQLRVYDEVEFIHDKRIPNIQEAFASYLAKDTKDFTEEEYYAFYGVLSSALCTEFATFDDFDDFWKDKRATIMAVYKDSELMRDMCHDIMKEDVADFQEIDDEETTINVDTIEKEDVFFEPSDTEPSDPLDEPAIFELFNEHGTTTDDYINLGLTASALILSMGVLIFGGKNFKTDFSQMANLLRSGTVIAGTGVGLYALIAKCFLNNNGERLMKYADDIDSLREDLEDFYDLDTAALNSSEALRSWNALQTRYNLLFRILHDENDRNLSEMFKQASFYYFKCHDKFQHVLSTINSNKPRKEPVFLTLYGPPGCGKTTWISSVLKPYFCKLFDVGLDNGCIEMTGENKYFPSFQGRPICIIDEYNQENPTIDHITTMTKMIGGNAFKADGASLEDKDQYFNAELVITASNRGEYAISAATCPAETAKAFWDRHNFFYMFSDGQEVANGRKKTPGSKLRFFRTNGVTPHTQFVNEAGTHYEFPNTIPKDFVEISEKQLIAWIVGELENKRDIFNMINEKQDEVAVDVQPDLSLITNRKPPATLGVAVGANSIFTKPDSIVTKHGIKSMDRKGYIADHLDLMPPPPVIELREGKDEPLPACPRAPPKTVEPIGRGLKEEKYPDKNKWETVNNAKARRWNSRHPNEPKRLFREDASSAPLVIAMYGRSNTGKSFTGAKLCREMSVLYGMKAVDTHGSVPNEQADNTLYVLDDVIPSQSEVYCDFWEKCNQTNVIILTSNQELPKWSRSLRHPMGYYDYNHFSSERLIRRAGFGGHINFHNNFYYIDDATNVIDVSGFNKYRIFDETAIINYTNVKEWVFQKMRTHLTKEVDIVYQQTLEDAPEVDYDLRIDLDPAQLHLITERDFHRAAVRNTDKVRMTWTGVGQWNDTSVFLNANLVPGALPRCENVWEQRDEFTPLLRALLRQKAGFRLFVKIGNTHIFTKEDSDIVFVKGLDKREITISEVANDCVSIVVGEEEWVLSAINVAVCLEASPNYRDEIGDLVLKEIIIAKRTELERLPSVRRLINKAKHIRAYENIKTTYSKELNRAINFARTNPLLTCVGGLILGAAMFYGIKSFLKPRKTCKNPSLCGKAHFLADEAQDWFHEIEDLLEEAGTEQKFTPFLYKGKMPIYQTHAHDQKRLGDIVFHGHFCDGCGCIFSHTHVIHATHISERYAHLCISCRRATKMNLLKEEGQLYEKAKKKQSRNARNDDSGISPPNGKNKGENVNASRYNADYSTFDNIKSNFKSGSSAQISGWVNDLQTAAQRTKEYVPKGTAWADFDDEGCWFYPIEELEEQMVTNYEIGKTNQVTSLNAISKKVQNNTVVVKIGDFNVHGLMLYGNHGVTIGHFPEGEMMVNSDEYQKWTPATITKIDKSRDLAFFTVENPRAYTDIRKYFVREIQVPSIDKVRFQAPRGQALEVYHGHVTFKGERTYWIRESFVTKKKMMEIAFAGVVGVQTSRPGDCGLAYLATDNHLSENPIVGIHFGQSPSSARSGMAMVCYEDLVEAFKEEGVSENVAQQVQTEFYGSILENLQIPVKFVADEETIDAITPIWAGGLLDDTARTHDLGKPIKMFPVGYVEEMHMPAGASKIPIIQTAWTNEMINKSDCVPAPQFAHQLDFDVQADLNTNNRGQPSIVATQISKANIRTGQQAPEFLRKEVTEELADFYYTRVKDAGGLRFYNTYEVINGVGDLADPLRGVAPIEPDASAGIYYNKVFSVHSKGDLLDLVSKPGEKTTFTFGKTPAAENLKNRYKAGVEAAKKGEQFIDLSNVKLKVELRPVEKAKIGKTRAFESEGTISYMLMKKFLGPMVQAFVKNRFALHHTGGQNLYEEWPQQYKRLARFPFVSGQDHENFDKSVMEMLIADVQKIVELIYIRAKREGYFEAYTEQELINITRAVFGMVCYSFEFIEGTLVITRGIVNSGIFITNWIDSMIVDLSQVYVTKVLVHDGLEHGILEHADIEQINDYPTLRDIHNHSDWITNGDDNLASYDEVYAKVMNFSRIKECKLTLLGQVCTPPSKTDLEYEFGTWESESFCSRFTRGTYPFITAALKKDSIVRLLHWTRLSDMDEYITMLESAVLYEAMLWQDEDFYNTCLADCRTIAKYLEKEHDFLTYQQQIKMYMQAMGLGYLSQPDLEIKQSNTNTNTDLSKIDSDLKRNKQETMASFCTYCTTPCKTEVALKKHLASAHFREAGSLTVLCNWCMKEMPIRDFLNHDHKGFACSHPGCSARPKNMASAEHHALVAHRETLQQCFIRFEEHAGRGITRDEVTDAQIESMVEREGEYDDEAAFEMVVELAKTLVETHCELAHKVMEEKDLDEIAIFREDLRDDEIRGTEMAGRFRYSIMESVPGYAENGFFSETFKKNTLQNYLFWFIFLKFGESQNITASGDLRELRVNRKRLFVEHGNPEGGSFTMGDSAQSGKNQGTAMSGAANPGATAAVAANPAEIVGATSMVASSVTLNAGGIPSMIGYGGVTASLEQTVRAQLFPYKTLTVTSATAGGTLIENIRYGATAGYFKAYLEQHERFEGDIEYYVQITGNAAFSGDIIVGWWFRNKDADVPPGVADPTLFMVDWQIMTVGSTSTTCFILNDARSNGFWRDTGSYAVDTGKPHLLFYVRNPIMNPVGDVNGTIYINIYHKPAANFIFAYPKLLAAGKEPSIRTAYDPKSAPSISLSDVVGTPEGYLIIDAANSASLPGVRSDYQDGSEFEKIIKGIPFSELFTEESSRWLVGENAMWVNLPISPVFENSTPKKNHAYYSKMNKTAEAIRRLASDSYLGRMFPYNSKAAMMRVFAAGTCPNIAEKSFWDALNGSFCEVGGSDEAQWWETTNPYNRMVTLKNAIANFPMRYILEDGDNPEPPTIKPENGFIVLDYINEVAVKERGCMYLGVRSMFVDWTTGSFDNQVFNSGNLTLELNQKSFVLPNPDVVVGTIGTARPVGGPHTALLHVSKDMQPFVPGDYVAPNTSVFPDSVTYALTDYLYSRTAEGSIYFFDIGEVGTSNTIASCKFDKATGVIQVSLSENQIMNNDTYWILKKTNFGALELKNFRFTSFSSEPPPLVLTHYTTRKIEGKKMIRKVYKELSHSWAEPSTETPVVCFEEHGGWGHMRIPYRVQENDTKRKPTGDDVKRSQKKQKTSSKQHQKTNAAPAQKFKGLGGRQFHPKGYEVTERDGRFFIENNLEIEHFIEHSGVYSGRDSIGSTTSLMRRMHPMDNWSMSSLASSQSSRSHGSRSSVASSHTNASRPSATVMSFSNKSRASSNITAGGRAKVKTDFVVNANKAPFVQKHGQGMTPVTQAEVTVPGQKKESMLKKLGGGLVGGVVGGGVSAIVGAGINGIMKGIELRDKRHMFDVEQRNGLQMQKNDHLSRDHMAKLDYSLRRAATLGTMGAVNKAYQGRIGTPGQSQGNYTANQL